MFATRAPEGYHVEKTAGFGTDHTCMHSIGPMDVHIPPIPLDDVLHCRGPNSGFHRIRASVLGGRPLIRTRAGPSGRRVEGIQIFRNDRWQPGGAGGQVIWVLSSRGNLGGFGEHW